MAGFPASRSPAGENGVGSTSMPSLARRARLFAARPRQVHPEVERRGIEHPLRGALGLGCAVFVHELLPEPIRKVGTHRGRQLGHARGAYALGEPRLHQALQRAQRQTEHPDRRGGDQRFGRGRAGGRLERAPPPQHRERRLGDEAALLPAQPGLAAKVARQRLVGGCGELEQPGEHDAGVLERAAREPHGGAIFVATCS
jgi:hypothetical protein